MTHLVPIQFRRGTAAQWTTEDPILLAGEMGIETDTAKLKFGDGVTVWSGLSYYGGGAVGSGPAGRDGFMAFPAEDGDPGMFVPGTPGTNGVDGAAGTPGASIPFPGADGEDGATFLIPGRDGTIGVDGAVGATGPASPPWPGNDGDDGFTFVVPGASGTPGVDGAAGTPGASIPFPGADGEDGLSFFIPGTPGAAGIDGAPGAAAASVPPPPSYGAADADDTPYGMPIPPSPAVTPAAAPPTFTEIEVSLGSAPVARRNGKFSITTSGLTSGKHVDIVQANGSYTGKGTRADEAEMDVISVTGKTTSTTNIDCYWESKYRVRGNYKFAYLVSA
jgi:hypothetical protein